MDVLEKGSENMVRRISLKIQNHHENDAYEMYAMKIKKNTFVSFYMYDDEGIFPHCHAKIWKKDGKNRKVLYHVAIRLDKPEFYHVKELGIVTDKFYLKSLITLLNLELENPTETVWEFLVSSWNLTLRNRKVNPNKIVIPEYEKLLR